MKVNKILFGVIEAIIFSVYNLIVFLVIDMSAAFWVSYAFSILSFVCLAVVMVFDKHDDVPFSISTYIVNIAYLALQLIVGGVLAIASAIPLKVTVLIEIVLFSVFLVISLLLFFEKNNAQKSEADTKDKVLFMKLLTNDIAVLIDKTSDATILARLEDLKDAVNSSDPMGHTSLALVDQKISNRIAELSSLVSTGDVMSVGNMIDEIEQMLADRNRKCKILK